MREARYDTTHDALRLSGLVILTAATALAVLAAVTGVFQPGGIVPGLVMVLFTAMVAGAALTTWRGDPDFGGVVAVIGAVGLIFLGEQDVGILALVGGILVLVAHRVYGAVH